MNYLIDFKNSASETEIQVYCETNEITVLKTFNKFEKVLLVQANNEPSLTEIVERMKELSQNLGAAFGRLISETMFPVVRRTMELMDEMGMIELPLKINGLQVTVTPVSPLAMAANMDKLNEVMQFMQISQMLGPTGQTLLRMDMVGDYIADQLGIPAKLRTTQQERQQMQEEMMQMAQMVAQQQGVIPAEGETVQ